MIETKISILCHKCNKIIDFEQGFIIQGNIYKVRNGVNDRAGIIGGNINPNIKFGDIEEFAFCDKCIKILFGWEKEKDEDSSLLRRDRYLLY